MLYRELNNALEREGEGLVANRGLVPAETGDKKLSENQVRGGEGEGQGPPCK